MKRFIVIAILLVFVFSACAAPANDAGEAEETAVKEQEQAEEPLITQEDTADAEEEESGEEAAEETDAEPVIFEPYEYEYTPYVITDIYRETFGEEAAELASEIIDAYIAFETSVPASDERTALDALAIARRSFPPFDAFSIVNDLYAYGDGRVSWELRQTKEDHEKTLSDFEELICEYMNVLKKDDCDAARAVALYREIITESSYDFSFIGEVLDDSPIELTAYHFLYNKTGTCLAYAGAYAYVLAQAGINSCTVLGDDEALVAGEPSQPHDWVMFEIDGEYYFADPTWEANPNELTFFGFPCEFRQSDRGGNYVPETMKVCGMKSLDGYEVTGSAFDEFRTMFGATIVKEWKFNDSRTGIIYKNPNGEYVEFMF